MICPNCNSDVADNSIMCPICGEPVAKRPSYSGPSYGTDSFRMGGFSDNQGSPSTSYMDLSPAKKKSNPAAIIISLILLVAVCVGGYFVYKNIINKNDPHKYDGEYKFVAVHVQGQTVSPADFAAAGYDTSNMSLVISGDEVAFVGWESFGAPMYGVASIEIKKGEVTLKGNGQALSGKMDGDTLIIYSNGGDMTFEKVEK